MRSQCRCETVSLRTDDTERIPSTKERKNENRISPHICCRYENIPTTCVTSCAQRASKNLPTCVRGADISTSSALQDLSTSGRSPPTRAFHPVWSTLQQHVTYATWLQKGALYFKLIFSIESLNFWRGKLNLCMIAETENRRSRKYICLNVRFSPFPRYDFSFILCVIVFVK